MKIEFLGAAETVTGSRTLLQYKGHKILIDCGLFQGPKEVRNRNWKDLDCAQELDAVILTHAHIDHSGYLPRLSKLGYDGPIYCSSATGELCEILLEDSAYLQEEDAKVSNQYRSPDKYKFEPLYNIKDAKKAITQLKRVEMDKWTELMPGLSYRLLRAGHILGSSIVQISFNNGHGVEILTFSGDLGNGRQNVIKAPVHVQETDYLVMEGTYGDRFQLRRDPRIRLREIILEIVENRGVLVIPSFAVGRTQEILYLIRSLEEESKIPSIPVYVDSPMALEATDLYMRFPEHLKLKYNNGELELPLAPHMFQRVRSADESMLLCMKSGPMIVISAAGMLTGGRVLHHLKERLPHAENTVLFVGYQAEETKGRILQRGLPKLRIHGHMVDVEAKVETIDGLSAHADSEDIMEWLSHLSRKPKFVFLNHGEPAALRTLAYRIEHELGLRVGVPKLGEAFALEKGVL